MKNLEVYDASFISYFLKVVFSDEVLQTSYTDGIGSGFDVNVGRALDPNKLKFIEGKSKLRHDENC